MSFRHRLSWVPAILAACGLCGPVWGADSSAPTNARWATYETDGGANYFALSVRGSESGSAGQRSVLRVAVVVDTSASQTGLVRRESLEIVDSLFRCLPSHAQVALLACDVDTEDLSGGLSLLGSDSLKGAQSRLEQRLPLGTTNMSRAMEKALAVFGAQPDGVVVYIGDGVSRSNILNRDDLKRLVDKFKSQRASIISLAVGPVTDVSFLATLANHTGGMAFVRANIKASSQEMAMGLANASTASVLWPEKVSLPNGIAASFPVSFPPIRFDRDSILVGELSVPKAAGELTVQGTLNGRSASMRWGVETEDSNPDFGFLSLVVAEARKDSGLALPTPGSDALRELGFVLSSNSDSLVRSGRFALTSGDAKSALDIAQEALRRDPNNAEAKSLQEAARQRLDQASLPKKIRYVQAPQTGNEFRVPSGGVVQVPAAAGQSVTPRSPSAALFGDLDVPSEFATGGDLLANEDQIRSLASQRMSKEVGNELREARNQQSKDPSGAKTRLKRLAEQVRRSTDLAPGLRANLQSEISAALIGAAQAENIRRDLLDAAESRKAAQASADRLLAQRENDQQSIQILVERFDALMDEHKFMEAKEIAPFINDMFRDSVIANAMENNANMMTAAYRTRNSIYDKQRGFLDSMQLVEDIAAPFVDGLSPVVYPPAEQWRKLTKDREIYSSIDLSGSNPREQKIYKALKNGFIPDYRNQSLSRVVEDIAARNEIPIVIDDNALEGLGITREEQITLINIPEISLRSVLRLILEPLELTYVIEDEVMRITDKDGASSQIMKIFPVGDLVVPISSGGGGMGGMMGGMGGGMMGGMGGMGGGMMGGMGGGMGGMGGGMGGMGGGMGGMGGGMGGMFAVPDEARKVPVATNSGSLDVDPIAATRKVLDALETANGESSTQLEADLHGVVAKELAAAKREIQAKNAAGSKKHFAAIIEMVSESLRRGYPQPWMYEALSISMQACDYPAKDIQRVLLSAVDFSGDIDDAIKISKYLIKHDMKAEGLAILRDVSRSAPLLSEPFEIGLPIAIELNDVDALRWASCGVLKQSWRSDKLQLGKQLVEQAEFVAGTIYKQLKDANRIVEAKAFQNEVADALRRDAIVIVRWTGEADVDVSVEEPAGTICDFTNPRTEGGGMMLGDGSSLKASTEASETYVCSQGFAGEYRVLIHRIWGEVSAGKVTVDIYTDYGTPQQNYIRHQVPVGEKDALVLVSVKNGHRDVPIAEAQLVKVEAKRSAAGQGVLNQLTEAKRLSTGQAVLGQLASNGNGSEDSYSTELRNFQRLAALSSRNPIPFGGRGAVGYMPQITVIPNGVIWPTAQAVISGDRRYVRFSNPPTFLQIGQVTTFNFISGQTGGGGAGGGAGGGLGGGAGGGIGGGAGGVF